MGVDTEKTRLELLVEESEKAKKVAEYGLFEEFSGGNFPNLARFCPLQLNIYKIGALATVISNLGAAMRVVRDNPEAVQGLADTAKFLTNCAAKIVGDFPVKMKEADGKPDFWINGDEGNTLRLAVDFGLYRLVDPKCVPSLAALTNEELAGIRARAISNGIYMWREIRDFVRPSSEFIENEHANYELYQFAVGRLEDLAGAFYDIARDDKVDTNA